MAYTGPDTGGVLIDGLAPGDWALQVFLPPLVPSILGQAVAIFVCYWEFVVLFPSEVKIWRRLYRQGHFRWQFAPLMTLFMRYFLLIYASAAAWAQYSTTMTNRACVADSVVFIIAVLVLNTSSIISMAWRSHAVARGVIETTLVLRVVQSVLFVMMLAAIGGVWWSMVQAQLVGSFLSRSEAGICVSDYSFTPEATNLVQEPNFWYYILSIFFDFTCMVTICISLKKLSKRSTGFSKLITQLFYHSLGYFIIIFLLFLLGIIWLRVQNAFWAANFIQMIQASIVIRILISEQNRAQKPHDTGFWDDTGYPGPGGDRTTQQPHGMTTYDSRYASDSRFAGVAADRSSTQGLSRIGDVEEGYELKATADEYSHASERGVRPRQPRRYDSDFEGSNSMPPSEAGQSEMQASSKTAHSERSLGTDDNKADLPVVTVEPLPR